jgi:hypothetical protein
VQGDDHIFEKIKDAILTKYLDIGFASHHNKFGLVLYGTVRTCADSLHCITAQALTLQLASADTEQGSASGRQEYVALQVLVDRWAI